MYYQKLAHGECMLDSVYLLLSGPPHNTRNGRKDVNFRYDVLNLEGMMGAIDVCKRVIRPRDHGHQFCFSSRIAQWYKMLSRAMEEERGDIYGGEGTATTEDEGRKNVVLDVEGSQLHYTREVGDMMTSMLSHEAQHINFRKHVLYFWRKASSFCDAQSRVNHKEHSQIQTWHQRWTKK